MKKITAKYFERATGRKPEDDDLERCNCELAGGFGSHSQCGWNWTANLPVFEAGPEPATDADVDDIPF